MESRRRWTKRSLALMLVAACLVPAMAAPASAQLPPLVACTAAGTVTFTDGSVNDRWTVLGKGSCLGDFGGTYFLQFEGQGTSTGLGLCDGGLFVQDLNITIRGFLFSFQDSTSRVFNHTWNAPLTTYPLVTPFLINRNSDDSLIGAGLFENHIFLKCTGSPVAYFELLFSTAN